MNLRKQMAALLAVLVLALAGCGAPSAPAAVAANSAPAALDPTSLLRDVDAQTTAALSARPDVVILDVREQNEWDAGHIPGALFIPMGEIGARLSEIPTDKTVIVQCRSGNRSSQVTDYLQRQGFTNVHNMAGGLNQWQSAGLPVVR